jgi:8-oxo-dGTP diphosphatase
MNQSDRGLNGGQERYQFIPRVLVFLTRVNKILLIKGSPTKHHWPNLYNGLGGHVERGESVVQAAKREVLEESGLQVDFLRLCAVVTIEGSAKEAGILMFVFRGEAPTENLISSSEGELEWILREELKDLDAVEDLPILLPLVLDLAPEENPFWGRYWYEENGKLSTFFE